MTRVKKTYKRKSKSKFGGKRNGKSKRKSRVRTRRRTRGGGKNRGFIKNVRIMLSRKKESQVHPTGDLTDNPKDNHKGNFTGDSKDNFTGDSRVHPSNTI